MSGRGLLGRRGPAPAPAPAARLRGARVLTASGRRIDLSAARGTRYAPSIETWQQEAWAYRASIGEVRYAVGYLRKAVSRVRIFPAVAEPDGAEPTPLADAEGVPAGVLAAAEQALSLLTAGTNDWASLLAPFAENFEVAGEAWLVGRPDPDAAGSDMAPTELWQIRSTKEIEATDRGWRIRDTPTDRDGARLDPDTAFVSRLWMPHPEWRGLADSPMGALLGPCEELQLVSRTIRGASRSRLAGAGLLLVPDEIDFQAAPGAQDPDPEDPDDADDFFSQLTRTMTSALEDEGDPSSVVPIVVKASAEALKEIRHLTLAGIVDEKLLGRIEAALRRIGAGLDVPPEIVTGMADVNHWCEVEDTEIFTQDRGWVRHENLQVGDLVRTLNHETGVAEWEPVQEVARFPVEDLEMVRAQGRFHDSLSTLNHRWPVIRDGRRTWTVAEDLRPTDRITRAAPAGDLPTTAKYEDAFVELVAWFVTEGTCTWPKPDHCQVRIGQSHVANPEHVERIRRTLTDLFGPAKATLRRPRGTPPGSAVPPAWREIAEPRGMTLFHLNRTAYAPLLDVMESWHSKVTRRDFIEALTADQLELFIATFALGDGFTNGAGGVVVDQRDPARLAPVELAGVLAGRPTRTAVRQSGGFELADQTFLTVGARYHTVPVGETSRETYTGTVWCPVTGNTTWLARRNGHVFYTGNTAWQVDSSTIKQHVEPLLIEMLGALTSGYLRHALTEYGVPDEWARRVICWYDVTPLTVRSNRSEDAKVGHERNVLSDVALVEALGFDPETDMPDEDELARRLAIGRGTVDATLMDTLLRMFLVQNLPEAPAPPVPIAIPSQPVPPAGVEPGGETPGPDTGLPIAAAGAPSGPVLRAYVRESERLARVDRETRERLAAAADAAVQRAVERATARAASSAKKTPEARAIAASAAPGHAYAALHQAGLTAALGLDPDTLLAGAWDQLRETWDRLTMAARIQAVESAARITGQDPPLAVLGALADLAGRGWDWLTAALTRETLRTLEDPETDTGVVDEPGEDPGRPGRVTSLARGALAIAGGLPAGHPGVTPDGTPAAGGTPPGGIAGGDVIGDYLSGADREVIGYEWVYGTSRKHFPPHRRLDGALFANYASPVLQNPEPWPSATLAPGDHKGCHCDAMPVWADGRLASLEQAAAVEPTYDDSYLQVLRQIAADDRAAGRTDTTPIQVTAEADRIANARPSRRS